MKKIISLVLVLALVISLLNIFDESISAAEEPSVVEVAVAFSGIKDVTGCLRRWLIRVVGGCPTDMCLALIHQCDAGSGGRKWLHGIVGMVHPGDVAKKDLVDAAGQIETEIRILSHLHIGEVLVREGFEDGTWYFGHTAFRVIAVKKLTGLPFTVFAADIVRQCDEQVVGKITGSKPRETGVEG